MNRVTAVGIGPGGIDGMTREAYASLEACDLIVGYEKYIRLVKPYFPEKDTLSTGMTKEADRCRMAIGQAQMGKNVCVVCSGDAGVYGMAGLLYELSGSCPDVEIEVIPGVTAALSGAALLGAPLMTDFCVISLSDRLTPKEVIRARLLGAAKADFVICLYNPSSHARKDYLARALTLIEGEITPDTVCGIARMIGRGEQSSRVLTFDELKKTEVDMFTTVFIGNSSTTVINGRMVTRRGYRDV